MRLNAKADLHLRGAAPRGAWSRPLRVARAEEALGRQPRCLLLVGQFLSLLVRAFLCQEGFGGRNLGLLLSLFLLVPPLLGVLLGSQPEGRGASPSLKRSQSRDLCKLTALTNMRSQVTAAK